MPNSPHNNPWTADEDEGTEGRPQSQESVIYVETDKAEGGASEPQDLKMKFHSGRVTVSLTISS